MNPRFLQTVLAFAETAAENSPGGLMTSHILAAIIFSAVGLAAFCGSIWVISKIVPFSLRKEIEEDQNTSLGIIIGAMIIGVSIIIAAAIHG
jgi:putative membrane protein